MSLLLRPLLHPQCASIRRELAQQVAAACRDLRKYSGLRSVCLTGGSDKEEQVRISSFSVCFLCKIFTS